MRGPVTASIAHRGLLAGAAAGAGVLATGVVLLDRRFAARRRTTTPQTHAPLGSLRGTPSTIACTDGLRVYAEIDEASPHRPEVRRESSATIVFVHGFALNMDCWHYQREWFRGKRRMVFFDLRSHGRTETSPHGGATIDQLGRDLYAVIDQLTGDEPIVLVGHSMGGMAIVALAEQHPELFGDKVVGVGLISTTAGEMGTHKVISRYVPDLVGRPLVERGLVAAALVDRFLEVARRGAAPLSIRVIHEFAFGRKAVPLEQITFLDSMIAATPVKVLVEFVPEFDKLDKFTIVKAFERVPTAILSGTADKLTPISHARRLHAQIEGSTLTELPGVGHMALFQSADEVTDTLHELFAEADATLVQ